MGTQGIFDAVLRSWSKEGEILPPGFGAEEVARFISDRS